MSGSDGKAQTGRYSLCLDPPLLPGTRQFLDALDAVLSLPVTDPRLSGRARTCAAVLRTARDAVTDDDLRALALVLWDAVAVTA
ncbi:MAG TPA: hypothetical protein VGS19_06340 [Streptosporangiaceae bacterium]|nr:hypothetical protein [Streptosporangiaceae bacterium]